MNEMHRSAPLEISALYMFSKLWLLSLCASLSYVPGQDTDLRTVRRAFEAASIPQAILLPFAPTVLFEVTFPQTTRSPITLHAGVQLPPNATAGPPIFSIVDTRERGPFVVAMLDLDALTPQDPNLAQIRHFLGGDFHPVGEGKTRLLANSTPALSNFMQPAPSAGSDPHRYVFLLFTHPPRFDRQTLVNATTSIENFNISSFAAAVGLGDPIGGTFMRVGPDSSTT